MDTRDTSTSEEPGATEHSDPQGDRGEVVAAEVVALDGGREAKPRAQEVIELLKFFVPNIFAGSAVEAAAWAKHYRISPQRYKIVYAPDHLHGLVPNQDMLVLVGTYRQKRTWEEHEYVTYLMQAGIRIIHGGPF